MPRNVATSLVTSKAISQPVQRTYTRQQETKPLNLISMVRSMFKNCWCPLATQSSTRTTPQPKPDPVVEICPVLPEVPEGTDTPTPKSKPIKIPNIQWEDSEEYHPNGSPVLWELNAFKEPQPFVPAVIKPKRGLRDSTICPEGYRWNPVIGCWVSEDGRRSWGTFKSATPKQGVRANEEDDKDCAVEECEDFSSPIDPAKELKRRGRLCVRFRDWRGNQSIVYQKRYQRQVQADYCNGILR